MYRWTGPDGKVRFSDTAPEQYTAEKITLQQHIANPADTGEVRRRELLQEAERNAERMLAEREVARRPSPAEVHAKKQSEMQSLWLRRQRCAIAHADLEMVAGEHHRTPRDLLERRQQRVDFWCEE